MENNLLKIDLDEKEALQSLHLIRERLAYLCDIGLMSVKDIKEIYLIHKTTFGCKIELNKEMGEGMIIIFQLLLGSDWRKEANTYLNHFILEMEYSNRLFTCKRYPSGELKVSEDTDITNEVKRYIKSKNRKKYNN